MKLNAKKFVFWLVCVCTLFVVGVCRLPLTVQTNLNSLIEVNNNRWPIDELTNKFSDVISIVIQSEDLSAAKNTANAVTDILSSAAFNNLSIIATNISVSDTVNQLNAHRNSFLSSEYRKILQQGDYAKITDNAVATISSSMAPNVLTLKDDPFLLTTNYVAQFKSVNGKWNMRDGFLWQYAAPYHYILISANITDATNLAQDIKALESSVQEYNTKDVQIFLSGIPVHTASMTQTSKMQLSLFSLIALVAAILLNWLLFRSTKALIPVVLSLGLGFATGAAVLFLCFAQPHILTFVFGITLIGLGIDYSFHFISGLIDKSNTGVRKNIRHSFLTTMVCFLTLAFSVVSLLQQISVFTIAGLTAIYLGWLVFMPEQIDAKNTVVPMPMALSKKCRLLLVGLIVMAVFITLPFMKAQNNMSQLYRPSTRLLQAETLMQNLNGVNTSKFLLIRGDNLDNVLATSEKIKDESGYFFDLSTIVPSKERQAENQHLIHALYKSQSKHIQQELGLRTLPEFTETPLIQVSDIQGNKMLANLLDKFMLDTGKQVYIVAHVGADFTTESEDAIIVSPAQQMQDLMQKYSNESYRLLAICGLALILMLALLYKGRALLYLMPSILAVGLTAATLTWFGQPITFFHLLSLFIVIGLTLDYSIFHINASDSREIKPVLFSFLTSLVGFGILGFASFFLIRSMGITLGLGLTYGYLISLFLFRHQK